MIKLIITDMDGTLLDDVKNLPSDYFEIVDALQKKEVLFAIASGRQYYTLLEQFFELKDSLLFIAENGTYVVFKGQVIHEDAILKSDAIKLIDIARKVPNAFPVLCCVNGAYVEDNDITFLDETKKYYKKLEIVPDISEVNDTILKVTLWDAIDAETNSYNHFRKFQSDFKVAPGGKHWLDVININANKGIAIQKVQKYLNISFDETLVFGDYLNDMEMMATAKFSYAMKNAHPDILKAASFITEFDNNESGVTKAIRLLLPV